MIDSTTVYYFHQTGPNIELVRVVTNEYPFIYIICVNDSPLVQIQVIHLRIGYNYRKKIHEFGDSLKEQ